MDILIVLLYHTLNFLSWSTRQIIERYSYLSAPVKKSGGNVYKLRGERDREEKNCRNSQPQFQYANTFPWDCSVFSQTCILWTTFKTEGRTWNCSYFALRTEKATLLVKKGFNVYSVCKLLKTGIMSLSVSIIFIDAIFTPYVKSNRKPSKTTKNPLTVYKCYIKKLLNKN